MRVIIASAEPCVRLLWSRLTQLVCADALIVEASSGAEALALYSADGADCIIAADLTIGTDGAGLCQAFRRCGVTVPLILITLLPLPGQRYIDDQTTVLLDTSAALARLPELLTQLLLDAPAPSASAPSAMQAPYSESLPRAVAVHAGTPQ
jgi:hypothetical protein